MTLLSPQPSVGIKLNFLICRCVKCVQPTVYLALRILKWHFFMKKWVLQKTCFTICQQVTDSRCRSPLSSRKFLKKTFTFWQNWKNDQKIDIKKMHFFEKKVKNFRLSYFCTFVHNCAHLCTLIAHNTRRHSVIKKLQNCQKDLENCQNRQKILFFHMHFFIGVQKCVFSNLLISNVFVRVKCHFSRFSYYVFWRR